MRIQKHRHLLYAGLVLGLLMTLACTLLPQPTAVPVTPSQAAAAQPTQAMVPPSLPTEVPTAPPAPLPMPRPAAVEPNPLPATTEPSPTTTAEPRYEPLRTCITGPGMPPQAPPAPAPTAVPSPCFGDSAPSSLSDFSLPEYMVIAGEPCLLMGASLRVNGTTVDSWGAQSMAGAWSSIQSGSCTVNYQGVYDWIMSGTYATKCPENLADFETPTSWPDNECVGRRLYVDGRLVDASGSTLGLPSEQSGDCEGVEWRYIEYWQNKTPTPVPEASTLLLLGSGITTLAGWIAWQRRRRRK